MENIPKLSPIQKDERKFLQLIDSSGGPDKCWTFRGNTERYSSGTIGGKRSYAHRISYELHSGKKISKGLCICHSCDNPWCVNPSHLWTGTDGDNARDSASKGRRSTPRKNHSDIGCRYGRWKVTSKDGSYRICKCECGMVARIAMGNLINGMSRQCRICSRSERVQRAAPKKICSCGQPKKSDRNRCRACANAFRRGKSVPSAWKYGRSLKYMAEHLGISLATVRQRILREGISEIRKELRLDLGEFTLGDE